KAATGKPIKFGGMRDNLDRLEPFHADRMASRILGEGDVLTLIANAHTQVDEKQAKEVEEKMRTMSFTFDDLVEQQSHAKRTGPLDELIAMITSENKIKGLKNAQIDERQTAQV